VIISGRRTTLSPPLKRAVERKVEKLERVLPGIVDVRVVCRQERFERHVRLTVRAGRATLSAIGRGPDVLTAVETGLDTLARQAREAKARRARRRHERPDLAVPVI